MVMTADFVLSLRWRDRRFEFRNLDVDPSLNRIGNHRLKQIWVPRLSFTNALESLYTMVDDLSTAVAVRQGAPKKDDYTSAKEGELDYL